MGRSPLILAALAKDAVPALDFVNVKPLSNNTDGYFDSALLTATNGEHYVVKMARGASSALALDTEMVVIRSIGLAERGRLPFEITKQLGETKDSRGNRALLLSYVYGEPVDLTVRHAGDPIAASVANALAAIHSLPLSIVENAGLPQYSPAELVRSMIANLDRAAQTGLVPAVLLNRWEQALEDVNLFRYTPTVIHGDINGENVIEVQGEVSGVLNWHTIQIGDPAQDLGWVVGAGSPDISYSILLEYANRRGSGIDENFKQRAQLHSELAHVRWLLEGIASKRQDIVDESVAILEDLASAVTEGHVDSIRPKGLGQQASNVIAAEPEAVVDFDLPLSPAAFMDNSQELVSDSFFAAMPIDETPTAPIAVVAPEPEEEILVAELVEEDVEVVEAVESDSALGENYNHEKLFAETAPIDLPKDLPSFLDDKTGEIRVNKDGELF